MRNCLLLAGAALAAGVVVAVVVVTVQGGGETVSAQEVADRAAQVQTDLLDQIAPDTTLHAVRTEYEYRPPESGVGPTHRRSEYWEYFGADGQLATLRTEVRDEVSGSLLSTGEWVDGEMVFTDAVTGEVNTYPLDSSIESLRATLSEATNATSGEVLKPDAAPERTQVDGKPAYVVEMVSEGVSTRMVIDEESFRPVQFESEKDGMVVASGTMPVFEILDGNAVPASCSTSSLASEPAEGRGAATNCGTETPSPSSNCCSLQLDFDLREPGIQASQAVAVGVITYIDVVLGKSATDISALQFTIMYDDTLLAPILGDSGTVNGNPDFNDGVLGTAWSCGLSPGSGTPDSDPATGPGHGVATLSCFTTTTPAMLTAPTVIATLRLTAVAPGESNLEITGLVSDFDGVQLGSCEPGFDIDMTCVGGTLTVVP